MPVVNGLSSEHGEDLEGEGAEEGIYLEDSELMPSFVERTNQKNIVKTLQGQADIIKNWSFSQRTADGPRIWRLLDGRPLELARQFHRSLRSSSAPSAGLSSSTIAGPSTSAGPSSSVTTASAAHYSGPVAGPSQGGSNLRSSIVMGTSALLHRSTSLNSNEFASEASNEAREILDAMYRMPSVPNQEPTAPSGATYNFDKNEDDVVDGEDSVPVALYEIFGENEEDESQEDSDDEDDEYYGEDDGSVVLYESCNSSDEGESQDPGDDNDGKAPEPEKKTKKLHRCVRCEGSLYFESKLYLYRHLIKEHGRNDRGNGEDLYSCRCCDKKFALKCSRDAHQKNHRV